MRITSLFRPAAALLLAVSAFGATGAAAATGPAESAAATPAFRVHHGRGGETDVNVCSDAVPAGAAHCLARIVTSAGAGSGAEKGGYDPSYLRSAYNAPSTTAGTGRTVAVVLAFDNPKAESDLAVYRKKYKLPACTTENGCFRELDQRGGSAFPTYDSGWATESSLDLDMVSAMCPNCHIVLVEADTNTDTDLYAAQNTAAAAGADVISNSWGLDESAADPSANHYFRHPGVVTVVATGDNGDTRSYPATSPDVIAVGGTSLVQLTNKGTRNASEVAWDDAGDGCSQFQSKPSWQTDSGCAGRTIADIAAVGDPETGVRVYDSNEQSGGKAWLVVGGTSAAAPIVAGMYALVPANPSNPGAYLYAHTSALNDIAYGGNSFCLDAAYVCTAGSGYDGPTGLGTPNGISALGGSGSPAPNPGDFTVNVTPTARAVSAGKKTTFKVTVTTRNGFNAPIMLFATTDDFTADTGFTATVLKSPTKSSTLTVFPFMGSGNTVMVHLTLASNAIVHSVDVPVNVM